MIILKENKPLKERGTVYTKASAKQAWDTLTTSIANHQEFQVHLGFLTNGISFMEARYNKIKVSGSQIFFRDTRSAMNRMDLAFRDIGNAEIGEDTDVDYITIRFDLKSKIFISVTPY
jgi:hypothetical protein